jgi:pimeloyl-ACP methyl ester carboxylesterase
MANIILVAGTHHGGWYWEGIAAELRLAGHKVFAPSLTGLDPEVKLPAHANLDTHIDDVLQLITANHLDEIVLIGHSYGGMVITGVADRTSAKIKSLVYLDAALPRSGQSEWDLNSSWLRERYLSTITDGFNIDVPQEWLGFQPLLMPHPFATKIQPLHFSQVKLDAVSKVYVHALRGFGPGIKHFFSAGYERSLLEPSWTTYSLDAGHDLPGEVPGEVLAIIRRAASPGLG